MNDGAPVRAVLQVHTRYRYAGGEDAVVEAERRLLEATGIRVSQVMFDNAELRESRSLGDDMRLAGSAIWSRGAARRVRTAVSAARPDVVHVHNTFAAASPSVYAAVETVPVVHTLHNYRMVCPVATTFRDGHACTDCVERFVPWPGVLHACVRGSRAQSAVAAATLVVHRALGTFQRQIGAYIALTEFQRWLMIQGGLPAKRIHVLPNFIEPDPGAGTGERSGVLYVGRLSEEKGIGALLRSAEAEPGRVRVAGAGPLASAVEHAAAHGQVEYLGSLERTAVLREMRRAVAVVLPSIWFEGFPLAIVEAYASGTPVIASRIGSLGELVEEGVTGLFAEPHDARGLAAQIRWAADHPREMRRMGSNARERYGARFRGAGHVAGLLSVYAASARATRAAAMA